MDNYGPGDAINELRQQLEDVLNALATAETHLELQDGLAELVLERQKQMQKQFDAMSLVVEAAREWKRSWFGERPRPDAWNGQHQFDVDLYDAIEIYEKEVKHE